MTKKETSILIVFIVVIMAALGIGGYFLYQAYYPATPQTGYQACTQEAKLCSDGSYVSRTGPNCEFAACPVVPAVNGWKTIFDSVQKIQYQYPETLSATYISTIDWPPQIRILNQAFVCTQGGTEIAQAGQTTQATINSTTYCITKETQGAAGGIYTQYAYATAKGNKTAIETFSLRFVQCANYPEPQKTACNNERSSFTVDPIADQVLKSLQFNQ